MKLRLLKLLKIPLLVTAIYFAFLLYPNLTHFGFFSVVEETPVNIQKTFSAERKTDELDIHLLKGEKVTAKLKAREDNLGILLIRFVKLSARVSDTVVFRIKKEGEDKWHYENKYRADQFQDNQYFPFGFPAIVNSKNNTYIFEVESTSGTYKNGISVSLDEPQVALVYKYTKADLKNYNTLSSFISKKLTYVARNVNFLQNWQLLATFVLSLLAVLFIKKKKITVLSILKFLPTLKKEYKRILKIIINGIKSNYLYFEKKTVNFSKNSIHWLTSTKFYLKFLNKNTKKRVIFTSILIFFVIIILLITAEAFSILIIKRTGYLWEPAYLRIIKGYETSHMYGSRTEDHSWGQWGVPNFAGNVVNQCMNFKITFNEYGARDKERSISGQGRTLVFGDSFIEGWGVDQDKTLPAYLEKISGKEFLNLGNSGGFSILNEYLLYKDFANKFEHEAVIVGLTVGNDFDDNNAIGWGGNAYLYYRPFWKLLDDKKDVEAVYFAPFVKGKYVPGAEPRNKESSPKVYENWTDFSASLNLLRFIQDHKVYFSRKGALAQKFTYNLDYSDDAVTAVVLLYDKFAKLIGDKKKYVVILPSATDVYHYLTKKQKAPKMEEFKKKLRNQGWQVIDAIEAFVNLPEEKISNYYLCDGHPSAKANELFAQYLYKSTK